MVPKVEQIGVPLQFFKRTVHCSMKSPRFHGSFLEDLQRKKAPHFISSLTHPSSHSSPNLRGKKEIVPRQATATRNPISKTAWDAAVVSPPTKRPKPRAAAKDDLLLGRLGTIAAATIQNGSDGVNHWLDSHHQIVVVSTAVMAVQCSPKLDQYRPQVFGHRPYRKYPDVWWCLLVWVAQKKLSIYPYSLGNAKSCPNLHFRRSLLVLRRQRVRHASPGKISRKLQEAAILGYH